MQKAEFFPQAPVDVDMTPMIDVVFQLLIFFTMVSVFNEIEYEAEIMLPEAWATTIEAPPKDRLVINVERDGRIMIFGREIDRSALHGYLRDARRLPRAEAEELPVLVRGHRGCPYAHVKTVLAAVREAGLRTVFFAAYEMEEDKP